MSIGVGSNKIVRYPDPRLREKCASIQDFDGSLASLAEQMLEIMKGNNGVGLAGPQFGVTKRIFVCNPTGRPEDDHVYINPILSDLSGSEESEEGCLSLPDVRVNVRRAKHCKICAQDITGKPLEEEAEGLLARIWQHETDHLEGTLIIDRMNSTDRIANKRVLTQLEAEFGG